MKTQTKTDFVEALPEIGRSLLVTGGFGLVLVLSSLGLLIISTSLALAVVLWASRTLVSAPVFVLIILSEVVIFSLAGGASTIGFGLILKGISDALMRSGRAFGVHRVGGSLEESGLGLGRWVKGLFDRTKHVFKVALGGRKKQLLLLLLLGLLPPLLAIYGRSIGAIIQPPGISMIKWAVPLSIAFFEYAGITLALALSSSLMIRRTEDHDKPFH